MMRDFGIITSQGPGITLSTTTAQYWTLSYVPGKRHFMIGVPLARAVNPISKTNWEGTGVEPDVKVPAAEALDVAKKLAAEEIKKTEPRP